MSEHLIKTIIPLLFVVIIVNARRECIEHRFPNADTVCVCNATYCDDFPALKRSDPGFGKVYESSKTGHRFKETDLKFSDKPSNTSLKTLTITINRSEHYQSINGFGGAFTDSTGQLLKAVNKSLADLLMESYFSSNGIEYSMARIPMAGTDYSDRPYSYDDVEGDLELKHFALQNEDLEWKIPFIKKALKLSPHKIRLFGSPWSSPAWMKTNNKFTGNATLKGEVGGPYYQTWAQYFVKFLNAYKSHGIDFWGLTVENEPNNGFNPKYSFNNLGFTAKMTSAFVKLNLGPTLAKAGYGKDKLKLMVLDDNAQHMEDWVKTILPDKEISKYVSGVAYHWYHNNPFGGFPDQLLAETHKNYSDYFTFNSEACHLGGLNLGNWTAAEKYSYDIIRAMNNYVTGWVEWNMALDMEGGHRWNTKHGYGGTLNIDVKKGEAYKQPSFYALGHFSKFVSPDSVRIGHKVNTPINGISFLTVKRPDNQTVLVALNANDKDFELHINDTNKYLSHKISGHSILSFIW